MANLAILFVICHMVLVKLANTLEENKVSTASTYKSDDHPAIGHIFQNLSSIELQKSMKNDHLKKTIRVKRHYGLSFHVQCKIQSKVFMCNRECLKKNTDSFWMDRMCNCYCKERPLNGYPPGFMRQPPRTYKRPLIIKNPWTQQPTTQKILHKPTKPTKKLTRSTKNPLKMTTSADGITDVDGIIMTTSGSEADGSTTKSTCVKASNEKEACVQPECIGDDEYNCDPCFKVSDKKITKNVCDLPACRDVNTNEICDPLDCVNTKEEQCQKDDADCTHKKTKNPCKFDDCKDDKGVECKVEPCQNTNGMFCEKEKCINKVTQEDCHNIDIFDCVTIEDHEKPCPFEMKCIHSETISLTDRCIPSMCKKSTKENESCLINECSDKDGRKCERPECLFPDIISDSNQCKPEECIDRKSKPCSTNCVDWTGNPCQICTKHDDKTTECEQIKCVDSTKNEIGCDPCLKLQNGVNLVQEICKEDPCTDENGGPCDPLDCVQADGTPCTDDKQKPCKDRNNVECDPKICKKSTDNSPCEFAPCRNTNGKPCNINNCVVHKSTNPCFDAIFNCRTAANPENPCPTPIQPKCIKKEDAFEECSQIECVDDSEYDCEPCLKLENNEITNALCDTPPCKDGSNNICDPRDCINSKEEQCQDTDTTCTHKKTSTACKFDDCKDSTGAAACTAAPCRYINGEPCEQNDCKIKGSQTPNDCVTKIFECLSSRNSKDPCPIEMKCIHVPNIDVSSWNCDPTKCKKGHVSCEESECVDRDNTTCTRPDCVFPKKISDSVPCDPTLCVDKANAQCTMNCVDLTGEPCHKCVELNEPKKECVKPKCTKSGAECTACLKVRNGRHFLQEKCEDEPCLDSQQKPCDPLRCVREDSGAPCGSTDTNCVDSIDNTPCTHTPCLKGDKECMIAPCKNTEGLPCTKDDECKYEPDPTKHCAETTYECRDARDSNKLCNL